VFSAAGRFGSRGIGVQPFDRPVFYFWTRRREDILTALAEAHFPVSWQERRVT
jgi:hypothetical protein